MQLFLARHGEASQANAQTLSALGRDQMLVLAFSIKDVLDAYYCSEADIEEESILIIEESRRFQAPLRLLPDLNPRKDAEDEEYFKLRVMSAFSALLEQASTEQLENILCMASLDVLQVICKEFLAFEEPLEEILFPLGSYQSFTL